MADWINHNVTDYDGEVGNRTHITRVEHGLIPVADVAHLKGASNEQPGEHRSRHGNDWESFKRNIANNGVQKPIFITVDHGEEPKISEGNHRRDAALELGLSHIPAEVRYFGHAEQQGGIRREGALQVEGTWKDVREKAQRIRAEGGVRIIAHQGGTILAHIKGDEHIYESSIVYVPGTTKTGAWFCACKWASYAWGRTGHWRKFEGRRCSHVLALQYEAQSRRMFGRTILLDINNPRWMDTELPTNVKVPGQYRRDLQSYSAWDRSSGEPVWKQPEHELIQDALIGWKGNTSDMRREVENELKGADPQQGNGTQKIWRAQARALLNAAKNGKPNPKPLYRGNPPNTKPRTLEEWTEDHKVAKGWAKKYGGEVHVIKPGEGKGIKISDHINSGLNEIEKGWVLHEPRPTTIYGANDFKVQRVSKFTRQSPGHYEDEEGYVIKRRTNDSGDQNNSNLPWDLHEPDGSWAGQHWTLNEAKDAHSLLKQEKTAMADSSLKWKKQYQGRYDAHGKSHQYSVQKSEGRGYEVRVWPKEGYDFPIHRSNHDTQGLAKSVAHHYEALGDDYKPHENGAQERHTKAIQNAYDEDMGRLAMRKESVEEHEGIIESDGDGLHRVFCPGCQSVSGTYGTAEEAEDAALTHAQDPAAAIITEGIKYDPAIQMAAQLLEQGTNPAEVVATLEAVGVDEPEVFSRIAFGNGMFKGKVRGVVQMLRVQNGQVVDSHGNVVTGDIINPDYDPRIGLTASREDGMTIDQDPEHALPVTYGEEEPEDENAVLSALRGRIAKAASRKTALKAFSPIEKQQLIDEGLGTTARNLADLDLTGTHYKAIETIMPALDDEWTWL